MYVGLDEVKPGRKARIIKIDKGSGLLRRRLLEMGVEPGAIIKVERVAPLGDPIEVTVKGYYLSLRRNEAKGILVEVLDDEEN